MSPPGRAGDPYDVASIAAGAVDLAMLDARMTGCRACPRLVAWREQVAARGRRSFAGQTYWGRPVPGFGDPAARLLVLGLAPAAHGGNRTGRVFTGDRSGDWLFAGLHRAGLANQPSSVSRDDGLTLAGVRVSAAVRCAPPGNTPSPEERDTCAAWLDREVELLRPTLRAVLALGGFAWRAGLAVLARAGARLPRPRPDFGHESVCQVGGVTLVGCFHPSQQNTFTGRLTEAMLDSAIVRAAEAAGLTS